MSFSRRDFLETSALSASGLMLAGFTSPSDAMASPIKPGSDSALEDPGVLRARLKLSINQDWQFFRPAEALQAEKPMLPQAIAVWEPANLPHTVRLEPRDVSGGRNYQGVCWYRKSIAAPDDWKGRIVYLKFQGAMQVADVWLNGEHLLTHYGGYIPFTIDLSKHLRFGSANELLIRLDNSDNPEVPPGKPQGELDFCYFGGLYRSVDIEVMHPVHITDPILADSVANGGIFVTYSKVAAASSIVDVQAQIVNESDMIHNLTVTQQLVDPDGKIAASRVDKLSLEPRMASTSRQQLQVTNAKLWHPDNPQLYWLRTTLAENESVVDDQVIRIGIRSIHFDKERGLEINGEPFFSIGANRHQDHPYVGYALPASAHYRDAYKLREAGFTSYRSHYPQDPSFMDACDDLGILAIVSNPGWQFMGDEVFKKRVYQDAREMIRRDRNRPSVLLWEAELNETDNGSVAAELSRIVHEEFPVDPCYTAGNPVEKAVPGFNGWGVTYVPYEQRDPVTPSWIREWGDQVDNWSDQQGRVRVARGWGETPMLIQALAHMGSLNRIYQPATKPAGADLWAGIDAFRGYHHQPFLGAPLDLFRLPKFDYFMFQSQRPPEIRSGRPGYGPMIFIACYGSFHSSQEVTVFSNCEQVRLTENGKVVATQGPDSGYQLPHPPFTFTVGNFSGTRTMLFGNVNAPGALSTPIGELLAEGLIGGKVVATHLIHSPGVPKKIELDVDTCGVDPIADGSDWVRVYAHVCDARGTTYPYSDDMITFSVSGEGAVIADERIFANPVRAEAGIATALVRVTGKPGAIRVTGLSPNLASGTVQFQSHARAR